MFTQALLLNGVDDLISDAFIDTNGTALASHAIAPVNIPATSWTAGNGTFTIQSNICTGATHTGGIANAFCNPGKINNTVTATVNMPTSGGLAGGVGITTRLTDLNNYILAYIDPVIVDPAGLYLYINSAGVFTQQAFTAFSFANNTNYVLSVSASGNLITASVQGAVSASFSTATFNTNTKVGIYEDGPVGNVGKQFKSFNVTNP